MFLTTESPLQPPPCFLFVWWVGWLVGLTWAVLGCFALLCFFLRFFFETGSQKSLIGLGAHPRGLDGWPTRTQTSTYLYFPSAKITNASQYTHIFTRVPGIQLSSHLHIGSTLSIKPSLQSLWVVGGFLSPTALHFLNAKMGSCGKHL